eukprot:SAG11_NODE_1235_length_5427_cov_12.391892_5_plen_47_part_00
MASQPSEDMHAVQFGDGGGGGGAHVHGHPVRVLFDSHVVFCGQLHS